MSIQTGPIEEILAPYLALIDAFLAGRISVEAFERQYLDTFLAETRTIPSEPFEMLNELFGDVDAFCGDVQLYRPGIDLDEGELRDRCSHAVVRLLDYQTRGR